MVLIIEKNATKESLQKLWEKLLKMRKKRGVDVRKYCGTVKFSKDGLAQQKEWRGEWDSRHVRW